MRPVESLIMKTVDRSGRVSILSYSVELEMYLKTNIWGEVIDPLNQQSGFPGQGNEACEVRKSSSQWKQTMDRILSLTLPISKL